MEILDKSYYYYIEKVGITFDLSFPPKVQIKYYIMSTNVWFANGKQRNSNMTWYFESLHMICIGLNDWLTEMWRI